MSDLVCRCGEPWSSDGGLHWSHTDMPWWEHQQCVQGVGCPCCKGDFEPTKERDERWHRSVQFLADGSATGDPYPGWPALTWPDYCRRPSGEPEYRGSDDDPWDNLIPAAIKVRFKDKEYQLGQCPLRVDMQEPKDLAAVPDKVSVQWAGVWVRLLEEKISDRDDAPLLERSNGRALVKMIEGKVRHWEVDDDGAFWFAVGYIRYGKAWVFNNVISFIDTVEHALEAHPLLDDDDFTQHETEAKQEILEEVISDLGLAGWVGCSDVVLNRYLESRSDIILDAITLDRFGKQDAAPDRKFFRELLAPIAEPQHHEILKANGDPQVYLLRQKPFEILDALASPPDFVTGLMIFVRSRKGGQEVAIEVRPSDRIALHEFRKPGTMAGMNWVRWNLLCRELQLCILDLIAGQDPKAEIDYCWWHQ
jgi:hypothetical protein